MTIFLEERGRASFAFELGIGIWCRTKCMWFFECPSYERVRNKYRDIFTEQTNLIQFMNTKKQNNLARSFLWKLVWEHMRVIKSNIADIKSGYPTIIGLDAYFFNLHLLLYSG